MRNGFSDFDKTFYAQPLPREQRLACLGVLALGVGPLLGRLPGVLATLLGLFAIAFALFSLQRKLSKWTRWIMAGAIVGTEARLGLGSIVKCGAVVDHHATVEEFGHLGVNASMVGGTVLGRGAWMQAGAALGYGVKVPAGVTLALGEAVDSRTRKYKNDQRL